MVIDEVGGCGDVDGCQRGIAHAHTRLVVDDLAIRLDTDTALCLQTGRDAFLFHTLHGGYELMAIHVTRGDQRTVKGDVEGEGTCLISLQVYNDDIVSLRGKAGTFKGRISDTV